MKKKVDPLSLIHSSGEKISHTTAYTLPPEIDGVRIAVEWVQTPNLIVDLDLAVFIYDERARLVERLSADNPMSLDGAITLEADVEDAEQQEFVQVMLDKVDVATVCVVLYVDGGARNFQHVQGLHVNVDEFVPEDNEGSFLVVPGADQGCAPRGLCHVMGRTRNNCHGAALLLIYKAFDGDDGSFKWTIRNVFESTYCTNQIEKDSKMQSLIINGNVPSLDKYRPRLFPNVGSICAKLSSKALPMLKDKFAGPGLPLDPFVETIFQQLFHVCPQLNDPVEAEYLVAMLYDMFGQIDLNGDGSVDWDEFTSFTVSTGVAEAAAEAAVHAGSDLDHYTIEYAEDLVTFKSQLHCVMREVHHVPSQKRVLVIPEGSNKVLIFDERGNRILNFFPAKAQASLIPQMSDQNNKVSLHGHSSEDKRNALVVYDAIYLEGRHLIAYTASDHTIGVCREKRVLEGQKPEFVMHRKIIYHQMLHSKLCWSHKTSILCSMANDNNVYGWNIDTGSSVFAVSRHTDAITDMLALDSRECFVTCSHDKRIVLWSMKTRRVKGVLAGHRTGVKSISVEGDVLLSSGFECDALTWDLNSKEKSLILRGHRFPLMTARLMRAQKSTPDELRAITADESGELRLWNVFVNEKVPDVSAFAPVLQTFSMGAGKPPENRFHSFVFPFDTRFSKGCYSNIQAFSTKIVQFIPEKNARAFQPPTCAAFNESTGCVAVAVSTNVLKYEVASGTFVTAFNNVSDSEVTAMCFDDTRGRKIYVGTNSGDIVLLNFSTGVELFSDNVHRREVTCLYSEPGIETPGGETVNVILSGSLDGQLRSLIEEEGELIVHHTSEAPFGYDDHSGVGQIKGMTAQKLAIVSSIGTVWTVWNIGTFKRLLLMKEESAVLDIEIVLDPEQMKDKMAHDMLQGITTVHDDGCKRKRKASVTGAAEDVVTVAVALLSGVMIYSFSVTDSLAVRTFHLVHSVPVSISSLSALHCSRTNTVNYSSGRSSDIPIGVFLIASCDDGTVVAYQWEEILSASIAKYNQNRRAHFLCQTLHQQSSSADGFSSFITSGGGSGQASVVATSPSQVVSSPPSPLSKKTADSDVTNRLKRAAKGLKAVLTDQKALESLAELRPVSQQSSACNTAREEELSPIIAVTKPLVEFAFLGLDEYTEKESTLSWAAHTDTITESLPLHKDGCFVSVAHDGFVRVWNIDKECLGEKMLTNLTDEMKEKAILTGRGAVWKFIQERIAVTEYHRKVARRLVRIELGLELPPPPPKFKKRHAATLLDGMNNLGANHPLHKQMMSSPIDLQKKKERDDLRSDILCELSNEGSLKSVEESFGSYMFKKRYAEQYGGSNIPPGIPDILVSHDDDTMSTMSTITTGSMAPLKGISPIRRKDRKARELWEPLGDAGGASGAASLGPVAFSEASLAESHHANLIDGEGHQTLRKFAKHKSDAEAFDKIIPDIYLRNPKMSTRIQIPTMQEVQPSELLFGNQKKLYKNAASEYTNKHSTMQNKIRTRHFISVNNIHHNVKSVGTMVHIQPKCVLDEVTVPTAGESTTPRTPPAFAAQSTGTVGFSPPVSATPSHDTADTPRKKKAQKKANHDMSSESDYMVHDIAEATTDARPKSRHYNGGVRGSNPNIEPTLPDGTVLESSGTFCFDDETTPDPRKTFLAQGESGSTSADMTLFEQGAFFTSAASIVQDTLDKDIASVTSVETKLDTKRISNLIRKMEAACDMANVPDWEREQDEKVKEKRKKKRGKKAIDESNNKLIQIEKKVGHAIRQVARIILGSQVAGLDSGRGHTLAQPKRLTNRMLLPNYTLDDVNKFILIFNKVDVDFSGSLDAEEWTKFFTSMNKSVTVQEAQVLFTKMDKNDDGDLSISELLPLVFSKATKEQLRSVLYYCQREIVCKKDKSRGRKILEPEDLDELFNIYDSELVGFVAVGTIKDRVRGMELPRQAEEFILRSIADLQEDEMVNPTEFHRIFEACLTKSLNVSEAISQLNQQTP